MTGIPAQWNMQRCACCKRLRDCKRAALLDGVTLWTCRMCVDRLEELELDGASLGD